jgi:DNA-binding MarR family transcriptional regulator
VVTVTSPTIGAEVAEALADLLRRASRARMYGMLTRGLDPALDEATYPVLSGLDRYGPASAAALAGPVGLDRSVVSRHAARLTEAGLVARAPDPRDGRATLLTLTARGDAAVVETRRRLAARFDRYLADWPGEQAAAFAAALRRFTDEALLPDRPGPVG